MKTNKSQIYINLFAVILGGAASYIIFSSHFTAANKKNNQPTAVSIPEVACNYNSLREGGYKFIKPVLFRERECEAGTYSSVKARVQNFIDDNKTAGRILSASVYMRDLSTGDWFSCNAQTGYNPGSLAKVPLLFCFLHKAQTDPGLLNKKVTFNTMPPGGLQNQTYSSKSIEFGHSYTIKELLEYMSYYSDNAATHMLHEYIDKDSYNKVFSDLGLPVPTPEKPDYEISARDYSRLLWVLYNGTYLSNEMSEYACSLLSKGEFKEGLLKALPADLKVVHKFGQVGKVAISEHQLHESAIIYLENKPYLITIMTKGKNKADLPAILAQLSGIVYEHMKTGV